MTTPDVRAWARENGYEVSDRGRLPVEVREAYVKAHPGAKKAGAKKAPARKAPARKTATRADATGRVAPQPDIAASATPDETGTRRPEPQPKPVSDDRRLVALAEELKALTERVEALEKAASSGGNGRSSRFRRKSR